MINIIENTNKNLTLKDYPFKHWLAFICFTIFVVIVNYTILFKTPIYSSLTCDRDWFNRVNCELVESALLKHNLRHQTINNISNSPYILKNGRILLNREMDLLHNRVKNNYFPSHSFLGFFDIYLYRFRGQAVNEVKQIKNFIHSQTKEYKLKITRKLFPLFYIPLLLLPATILIGIFATLMQPITTYTFDFQQKNLTVLKKSKLIADRKSYSTDELSITSIDEIKSSIVLNTNNQTSYLLNDFQNKQQASEIIDTLQQHIK